MDKAILPLFIHREKDSFYLYPYDASIGWNMPECLVDRVLLYIYTGAGKYSSVCEQADFLKATSTKLVKEVAYPMVLIHKRLASGCRRMDPVLEPYFATRVG